MSNAQAVKTAIGNTVNRLYGGSSFNSFSAPSALASVASAEAEKPKAISLAEQSQPVGIQQAFVVPNSLSQPGNGTGNGPAHGHPTAHGTHVTPPNQGLYDWTARVEFKKYEIGCSFSVLLFLGEVPQDPEEWLVCPNFVGAHHAFVNTAAEQCANCRRQADLVEEGFVHLNNGISQHSGLGSLDPEVVHPYLTQSLQWRVQKVDSHFNSSFVAKQLLSTG